MLTQCPHSRWLRVGNSFIGFLSKLLVFCLFIWGAGGVFFYQKSKILWHCTFKIIHGPLYMVHILTYIFLLYSKFYSKMFTVNAIFFPKTCWIINFRIHRNSFLAKRFKGAVSHENVWNDFKHQLFKWYCPSGLTLLFAILTWQQIENF